jgi:hypothetical protein
LTKNGWATLWAIFSQTHLVTLPTSLKPFNIFTNLKLTDVIIEKSFVTSAASF